MIKHIKISNLSTKLLRKPLTAIVEPDNEGYIARTIDLPLYGYGDTEKEAVDNLKYEIETTYNELIQTTQLSEEWLRHKKFLQKIIV